MTKNNFEIIPAIDLIDGHCVRLVQGNFDTSKQYSTKPVEIAKMFQDAGIKRLHLVDLDGAKNRQIQNLSVLEEITHQTTLKVDFGGGVNTAQDVQKILNAGAEWVCVGSLAVKDKILWKNLLNSFGSEKFFLGADVLQNKMAIHGWQNITEININDFIIENIQLGIQQLFITDIEKDGLLQGPSIELYKQLCTKFFQTKIIASGGVYCLEDIDQLIEAKCGGVIIGKALYENKISLQQLKKYL